MRGTGRNAPFIAGGGGTAPSTASRFPSLARGGGHAPSTASRFPSPARGGGIGWRADLVRGLALAAAPGLAFAHPGHHEELTLAQQAWHLVSQPDHLLAFGALVAVIAAGGWTWARRRAGR
ncbi:hypothetical protein [Phenylobacterium sp. SCN 70-31]|uniref:hypothetical protein n=1 Tax=Phenylobacterium sp. SCN 70-31 TaxID=1660129 RepID=UPI00086C663D|nr:hypothetical protein [Phenylobacterium sp. SCN 70-31]ODT89780.1 MAG: hypothetical protein ABS78_00120 [Phenylobacterium sp. SCN 70-31]